MGRASLLEELLQVSSGKFVRAGLLGELCRFLLGNSLALSATWVGTLILPVFGTFSGPRWCCGLGRASLLGELLQVSSGKSVGSPGDPCGGQGLRHRARGGGFPGAQARPDANKRPSRSNNFQGEVIGEGGPRATAGSTGGSRRHSVSTTNGLISSTLGEKLSYKFDTGLSLPPLPPFSNT